MINPQWHELPVSQTIFYGPKEFRAIEVRLYFKGLEFNITEEYRNAYASGAQ